MGRSKRRGSRRAGYQVTTRRSKFASHTSHHSPTFTSFRLTVAPACVGRLRAAFPRPITDTTDVDRCYASLLSAAGRDGARARAGSFSAMGNLLVPRIVRTAFRTTSVVAGSTSGARVRPTLFREGAAAWARMVDRRFSREVNRLPIEEYHTPEEMSRWDVKRLKFHLKQARANSPADRTDVGPVPSGEGGAPRRCPSGERGARRRELQHLHGPLRGRRRVQGPPVRTQVPHRVRGQVVAKHLPVLPAVQPRRAREVAQSIDDAVTNDERRRRAAAAANPPPARWRPPNVSSHAPHSS